VENVGSHTLASAVSMTRTHGAVASCGNASGMDYPGSVAPFILRGVTLYGIDSNTAAPALREAAWGMLASDVDPGRLASMTREVPLADAMAAAEEIVAARVRGGLGGDGPGAAAGGRPAGPATAARGTPSPRAGRGRSR